MEMEEKSRK